MSKWIRLCGSMLVLALVLRTIPTSGQELKRAAPADAYMVVYAQHNPERDYQQAYYAEVWKAVEDSKIADKMMKIISSRASDDDRERAEAIIAQLKEAVSPIDWSAVKDVKEVMYAQAFDMPMQRQLVCCRSTEAAANGSLQAVRNLFGLLEEYSGGQVVAAESKEGGATILTLEFSQPLPFSPACAVLGDVFMFGSTRDAVAQAVVMLGGSGQPSKFDDPRIQDALSKLPAAEDATVVFDGKVYFEQLHALPKMIREQAADDEGAQRAVKMLEAVLEQVSVIDYEVTVEYTDGYQNRSASYGRLLPHVEDRVLTRMMGSGQPFEDWSRWVPADAKSFALNSGITLHPLYEWMMEFVPTVIPEVQEKLDEFEALQEQYGVHLDRDFLQAFSGESVSVSMPPAVPSPMATQDSVQFVRCSKPERIKELLGMAIDALRELPPMKAQNLALKPSEDLEGFDELSAVTLAMFGVKPLIGFQDGWMIIGSNAAAIQKVFDVQAQQADSFADSARFKEFALEVDGPVASMSYVNTAQQTREIAQALGQVGMILPGVLAMAGADQDSDEAKLVGELLGLLPSVARIINKFDFLEAKMSVVRAGDVPGSYRKQAVVLVRTPEPPAEASEAVESSSTVAP